MGKDSLVQTGEGDSKSPGVLRKFYLKREGEKHFCIGVEPGPGLEGILFMKKS